MTTVLFFTLTALIGGGMYMYWQRRQRLSAAAAAAAGNDAAAALAMGNNSSSSPGPAVATATAVSSFRFYPAMVVPDSRQLFATTSEVTALASALPSRTKLQESMGGSPSMWGAFREFASDFLVKYIEATERGDLENHAQLYKAQDRQNNEVYDSPTHKELATRLFSMCQGLQSRKFANKNGMATAVYVGTKGIGKSWMLRLFVSVCNSLFPEVLAMYITLESVVDHPLSSCPLLNAVKSRLFGSEMPDKDLFTALARAKKRILLIVDELDVLYLQVPSKEVGCAPGRNVYLDTLHHLNQLGNNSDGRVAVVLCGSTLLLHQLVKAEPSLASKYQMISDAPNLNDAKFRPIRIHGAGPTSLAVAKQVAPPGQSEEQVREALFLVGGAPRDLDFYFDNKNRPINTHKPPDELREWWKVIIDRMRDDNIDMLKIFEQDRSKIQSMEWEKAFKPLSRTAIDTEIWPKMMARKEANMADKERQDDILAQLMDMHLFCEDQDGYFYPFTMNALLDRHHDKETSSNKEKAKEMAKAAAPQLVKHAAQAILNKTLG